MPAKSAKQKKLMNAVAHSPLFAKKVGIPTKVAKEYANGGEVVVRGTGAARTQKARIC